MEKKTKSITITQYDYVISNVNDEELDIHGHLHQHLRPPFPGRHSRSRGHSGLLQDAVHPAEPHLLGTAVREHCLLQGRLAVPWEKTEGEIPFNDREGDGCFCRVKRGPHG